MLNQPPAPEIVVSNNDNVPANTPTLRFAYVGPNMDLVMAAYSTDHRTYNHEAQHVRSVSSVNNLRPLPDVVLVNPMVITVDGVPGACALQEIVSPDTLIVALYTSLGSSHSMFTRHALSGCCHPRMLLHYPTPPLTATDVVGKIDQMTRGRGGGPAIDTTGHLPNELSDGLEATDLGALLAEEADNHRSKESLTYARLLYAAAVDTTWSTWGDLANILGFALGHVKNTKAKLGRDIRTRVMPVRSHEVGVPPEMRNTWRIAEFTRFVTEHRSFIRAYCEHHLGMTPPAIIDLSSP